MPAEIESAAVSPDGRVWYLMAAPAAQDLRQSAVRQVVEREFSKPSPQLQGVKFVFFDPRGTRTKHIRLKRLWMMCRRDQVLLGYDGKEWIERGIRRGVSPATSLPAGRSFNSTATWPFWKLTVATCCMAETGSARTWEAPPLKAE